MYGWVASIVLSISIFHILCFKDGYFIRADNILNENLWSCFIRHTIILTAGVSQQNRTCKTTKQNGVIKAYKDRKVRLMPQHRGAWISISQGIVTTQGTFYT